MSDETLEKALKLLDEGRTPAQIFNIFQEDKAELESIFNLLGRLKTESKKIELSQGIKSKIKNSLRSKDYEPKPTFDFIQKIQARLKFIIPVMAVTAIMLIVLLPKNSEPIITKDAKQPDIALNQETNPIDETASQIITDFTNDNSYTTATDEEINNIQETYSDYNINDVYNEETF